METVRKGSKGTAVKVLQYLLEVEADGIFGKKTQDALKKYQKKVGLTADGVAGKNTWTALAKDCPTIRQGHRDNNYMYAIETLICSMCPDGEYKADEVKIIKEYQFNEELTSDGIIGQKTIGRLFGITQKPHKDDRKQPVDYKQFDTRWANVVYTKNNTYNKKQTIKSGGCGPTSMADVIATWCDNKITPVEMAKYAVDHGYRTENSGTSYGFFKAVAKEYGLKMTQTASFSVMQSCIAAGGIVVVNFGDGANQKWTTGG